MAEPFLSEIRIMSFGFAPKGWALCNGQLLPINQNQALFSLLGTTYGGNGQTNFALPNLQGDVPIHVGQGFLLGNQVGEATHTLIVSELPQHTHVTNGTNNDASTPVATGNVLGQTANLYNSPQNLTSLVPTEISNTGGSQPHDNMMPYLVLCFCIALQGIFPSQN
jgi:microcystin-dependent protein